MKIQPVDSNTEESLRNEKPLFKSRLKKLFDRQFLTRNSSEYIKEGGGGAEFEPNSLCLDKLVKNFIEDGNEKQPTTAKICRNRCSCFNGDSRSSSDESDLFKTLPISSSRDVCEKLKALILPVSVAEKTISAEIVKIVESHRMIFKRKDVLIRIVTEGLSSLGHDASICKSRWEKSATHPAGQYEFIDVNVEKEKLVVDVDFRSEFAIARATGSYRSILQSLPYVFVGKSDRLDEIVSLVSDLAKQSLTKKGLHVPPWRKAEYMRAKWFSPSITRATTSWSSTSSDDRESADACSDGKPEMPVTLAWQPPELKSSEGGRGTKIVAGLASLLKEKP